MFLRVKSSESATREMQMAAGWICESGVRLIFENLLFSLTVDLEEGVRLIYVSVFSIKLYGNNL